MTDPDPAGITRGAWPEGSPATTGPVPVLSRSSHDRAHQLRSLADPAGGRPVRAASP